ncbi:MAG TPA: coenzyme F420-0:L-glutamate ligase [Candidatus Paceibacterota bacterium]|nr:coenzyme F420-0:L-glutamate ligase [Candidatus Paceibacterota bacterium]
MKIKAIKTAVLHPPKDDLFRAIGGAIRSLPEKSIVVVTSKVVSIGEGRCVPVLQDPERRGRGHFDPARARREKDALTMREADLYLPREATPGAWCMHTVKNNIFIPSAGVDESNADGFYILWPRSPAASARQLWAWLRRRYRVRELGVIISDSHTIPLRRGVLGISLAHYGFAPLHDYRGSRDLFGRELKMTQKNIPDSLAAAAVALMGEGAECTPLALVTDVPWVRFGAKLRGSRKPFSSFEIRTQEDLYYPLLSAVKWRKGGGGKRKKK